MAWKIWSAQRFSVGDQIHRNYQNIRLLAQYFSGFTHTKIIKYKVLKFSIASPIWPELFSFFMSYSIQARVSISASPQPRPGCHHRCHAASSRAETIGHLYRCAALPIHIAPMCTGTTAGAVPDSIHSLWGHPLADMGLSFTTSTGCQEVSNLVPSFL